MSDNDFWAQTAEWNLIWIQVFNAARLQFKQVSTTKHRWWETKSHHQSSYHINTGTGKTDLAMKSSQIKCLTHKHCQHPKLQSVMWQIEWWIRGWVEDITNVATFFTHLCQPKVKDWGEHTCFNEWYNTWPKTYRITIPMPTVLADIIHCQSTYFK